MDNKTTQSLFKKVILETTLPQHIVESHKDMAFIMLNGDKNGDITAMSRDELEKWHERVHEFKHQFNQFNKPIYHNHTITID